MAVFQLQLPFKGKDRGFRGKYAVEVGTRLESIHKTVLLNLDLAVYELYIPIGYCVCSEAQFIIYCF